jgi:hypothetical protein
LPRGIGTCGWLAGLFAGAADGNPASSRVWRLMPLGDSINFSRRLLNFVFRSFLRLREFEFVSDFEFRASGFRSHAIYSAFAG